MRCSASSGPLKGKDCICLAHFSGKLNKELTFSETLLAASVSLSTYYLECQPQLQLNELWQLVARICLTGGLVKEEGTQTGWGKFK